uniref:Ubiquitin hydrolase n=1 Tax=Tanacetum cinerariifolium TaxID=118510 RepID=A0A6L2LC05_TANCI|nr:ubiquitin hydrolase [Tanacetum cinerariifolium]
MNLIATQQAALDNALVPFEKRLKIERCNARIAFSKPQKEETYQVTLEALKLSLCYHAFVITVEVLEIYMHQFWNTIKKIGKKDAYDFKLDKKKCRVDIEKMYFHLSRNLVTLATAKCFLPFILIKCTSLKGRLLLSLTSVSLGKKGLDRLRELRAQILWAMYNKMNVDYVALLYEDFMYQSDNKEISSARKEHTPYPRFTKVIINNFISKDNTISMRNMINLHTVRDDTLLGTLKFVSKTEYYHIYEALIPDGMINDDIKLSTPYKTYLDYVTGKVPPKKVRKFKKPASLKPKTVLASPKEPTQKGKRVKRPAKKATTALRTGVVIRDTTGKSVSKKKAPAKTDRGKGIKLLSDAALLEDAQLKKTMRKSKKETHKLQASGSSEGANFETEVPDEQTGKTKDISEGTGVKPGVPDVSKEDSSDSDDESWGDSEDESDDVHDEDDNDDDDVNDDDSGNNDDGGNDAQDKKMYEEEDDDVAKVLYGDLNITLRLRDTDMTNAEQGGEDQQNASHESGFVQEEEDAHATLTTVHDKTEGPLQSSSVSSYFTSKLLNLDDPSLNINSLMDTSTIPLPPLPVNPSSHLTTFPQQQTPDSTTTTTTNLTMSFLTLRRDDQDKDKNPFTGSDRGMKRRKLIKDAEPSKGTKSKESKSFSSSKGTQSQPKYSGRGFNLLKGTCKSFAELECHFEKCYKVVNDKLDWNNLEGHAYPFDLSKPLPLIEDRGRQVVHVDYFINIDLEYLKGRSSSSKYATSTTRTKAAKYDNIKGIEDMQSSESSCNTLKIRYATEYNIWGATNNKWYQSLVRSFDQEKNNIQAQQKKKMVKSSLSLENEPCFSKACKKNTDSLNSKITDISEKLGDRENMLYHYKLGLSQVEARLVEFKDQEIKFCEKIRGLEFKVECRTDRIESLTKELEELKKEKEGLDTKLTGFQTASKDLDNLLESQRTDKNKEDDTITDYSRPSPAIESNSDDLQNRNSSVTKTKESLSIILSKPAIKFVKAADRPTESKKDKVETAKKPAVKYAKMYKRTSKSSNVRGNQRNWNNLKSQQSGNNFLMKNKACFNCGQFDHLSYDCGKWVEKGKTRPKNNHTHKSMPPRAVVHKTVRSSK